MKRLLNILAIATAVFLISNCEGDYRPEAHGLPGDVVVVMDSTQWHSPAAQAIREVYGQGIRTLPQWEPLMDLKFRDFRNNKQLERLRKSKNLIIAAPLEDSTNVAKFIRALLSDDVEQQVKEGKAFAFPLQNQWYKNQWTIILTASDDTTLANKIRRSKKTLANQLLNRELQRWTYDIYDKAEQTNLEDSLLTHAGWKIRIQHDWRKHIDTTYSVNDRDNHFFSMRRNLPDNQRWFWVWWTNDRDGIDSLSTTWINNKRDSLMKKYIRGTRDSSYITTDYQHYPTLTDTLTLDGHPAYETQGVWHMTHDAMAGPFVNMTIRDQKKGRLFMLEFGQFAPKYDKRRFVRQFCAMLRTFKSDSSWSASKKNTADSSE